MELIEKALIKSGAINEEDLPEDDQKLKKYEFGRFYHKNSETKEVYCRHSYMHDRIINRGDLVKSSNRNEVLLGKHT